MARARRRSRTPAGRTERQSRREHHPGHRPGKVRADVPRDTRQTRYSPIKETAFALPQKGEYGGAGGVEGNFPLSPHAPRRAGDPPPVPGSSRRPRPPNDACGRKAARLPPHYSPQKNLTFSTPLKFRDFFCCRQKKPPRRDVRASDGRAAGSEKKTP